MIIFISYFYYTRLLGTLRPSSFSTFNCDFIRSSNCSVYGKTFFFICGFHNIFSRIFKILKKYKTFNNKFLILRLFIDLPWINVMSHTKFGSAFWHLLDTNILTDTQTSKVFIERWAMSFAILMLLQYTVYGCVLCTTCTANLYYNSEGIESLVLSNPYIFAT